MKKRIIAAVISSMVTLFLFCGVVFAVSETKYTQKASVVINGEEWGFEDVDTSELGQNVISGSIFEAMPRRFDFASGSGGWGTNITINRDGTFVGEFHDSNMGEMGNGYPNGTVYICNFSGKFTNPVKVNNYEYSMKMEYLKTNEAPNKVYYKDGVRYITSTPYGLEKANELHIYVPGAQVSSLPEMFKAWGSTFGVGNKSILQYYGIYNVNEEYGFVGGWGTPEVPVNVKAVSAGPFAVRVQWNTVSGASHYEIWRSASQNGTYTRIATVSGRTNYTNNNVRTSVPYYYKVRAKKGNSYSGYSAVVSGKSLVVTPATINTRRNSASAAKISWTQAAGASGYEVYRAASYGGNYSRVGSTNKTSYVNGGLKSGRAYYYRIRAYRIVDGKRVYGRYSNVKGVRI